MYEIKKYIADNHEEYISLIKKLVSIKAPSGNEDKRVFEIHKWLIDNDIKAYIDDAKNVIITEWFCEKCSDKNFKDTRLIMAHTDTVFSEDIDIEIKEDDKRISAPGIGDDTTNVAALMMACKYMKNNSEAPKMNTLIALNSCEEGLGNLKGCKIIMAKYSKRIYEMTSFDLGYDKIRVAAVGSMRFNVSVKTIGGHSFFDFGKENAIFHASKLVSKLYEIDTEKYNAKNTYNVGVISGGTSVNTIAPNANFLFEVRSDNGEALEDLKEQFYGIINQYKQEISSETAIEVECIGERPSARNLDEISQRHLIERGKNLIYDVTGNMPAEESASTDCNIPLSLGIPSICMGSYIGALEHTVDEYIEKSSLDKGLELVIKWMFLN